MTIQRTLNALGDRIGARLDEVLAGRAVWEEKPDGSLVTSGDYLVETIAKQFIADELPSALLLSEESALPEAAMEDALVVIIDPIDGTENFFSGLKEWGTGVSIWDHGKHLGSMLALPELGERMVTGEPITKHRSRITGLSSTIDESVRKSLEGEGEFRIIGCAVYNLFNVVRGSYRRFVNPRGAYVWDLVPGIMLGLEHGCDVIIDGETYGGHPLDPARRHRVDIRHRHDPDPR